MAGGGAAHRSDPGLTSSSHSLCGFKEDSVAPPALPRTMATAVTSPDSLPARPPLEAPTSLCPSWFIFSSCPA